jgi:hypothetical protein
MMGLLLKTMPLQKLLTLEALNPSGETRMFLPWVV